MATDWLAGKNIVIIGGTSGLGLSAALACREAGANVVVNGRKPQVAETAGETLGSQVPVVVGDAMEEDTAESAIACCIEKFGSLHGLYHVAGGSGRSFGDGPLHDITLDGWEYTLRLNLTSMMLSNRAAVRHFLKQPSGGVILNMGSVLGYSPSPVYFATHAYAAAKSAIIGYSKSIAAYYAPQNIRVNVIVPALVETPMSVRAVRDPLIHAFAKTKQPLDGGRVGVPEDLDGATVFLLSDQAKFITGQVLAIDGGWDISEGQL